MTVPAAALGPSAYWYLARGTGAVALILLSASVVLGVLGPLRFSAGRRWPRFTVEMVHRHVSLLVLALIAVHVVVSVLDSFAPIGVIDGVLPFASSYRPIWLGLGALSFDLLIAVALTSLVRRRLGYSAWRAVHWLAYASWPVSVLHGLGTGSDTRQSWMLALTAGCTAAVLVAVALRLRRPAAAGEPPGTGDSLWRGIGAMLAVATPIALAVFTLAGPLQRGWARRAGTPIRLLGAAVPAPASGRPAATSGRARAAVPTIRPGDPFSASLTGRMAQHDVPGGVVIDLSLRLGGPIPGRLRVRLAGAPISGGGLSLTGSQVDLGAPPLEAVLQGQVVSLEGQRFLARVASSTGTLYDLQADLSIDQSSGAVTGTLDATPAPPPAGCGV